MAMAMASTSGTKSDSSSSSSGSSWGDINSIRTSPTGTPIPSAAYALNAEEAIRMLQREVDQSSVQSSRANSRKTSPPSTPKSPPNSPRSPPSSPRLPPSSPRSSPSNTRVPPSIPMTSDDRVLYSQVEAIQAVVDSIPRSRSMASFGSPLTSIFSQVEAIQAVVDSNWQGLYANEDDARRFSDHFSSRPAQHPPKKWVFRSFDSGAVGIKHARAKDEDKKMFSRKGVCVLVFTNVLSLILGGLGVMLIRIHWQPSLFSIQLRNLN